MKKFFLASVLASTSAVAGMSLVVAPALQAQAPAASDQVSIKDPADHIARNPEILHRPRQCERVRRNNHRLGLHANKRPLVKCLRIDNCAVHIGKNLELVRHPKIVAVRGEPVRDDPFPYLFFAEGLNHSVLERLFSNPAVILNRHNANFPLRPAMLRQCN